MYKNEIKNLTRNILSIPSDTDIKNTSFNRNIGHIVGTIWLWVYIAFCNRVGTYTKK